MVEKWLLQVEETMIASVRKVISESFSAYANSERSNWVLEWPGQVVICVSSIFWTAQVTDAMKHTNGVQVSKVDIRKGRLFHSKNHRFFIVFIIFFWSINDRVPESAGVMAGTSPRLDMAGKTV